MGGWVQGERGKRNIWGTTSLQETTGNIANSGENTATLENNHQAESEEPSEEANP